MRFNFNKENKSNPSRHYCTHQLVAHCYTVQLHCTVFINLELSFKQGGTLELFITKTKQKCNTKPNSVFNK